MTDNWYWLKDGQKLGPVSTEALLAKIGQGEITGTDRVRFGNEGDWEQASGILKVLQENSNGDASGSAAEAIDKARLLQARHSFGHTARVSRLQQLRSWVGGVVDAVTTLIANTIGLGLAAILTKPGRIILAGVMLSTIAVLVLPYTSLSEPSMARVGSEIDLAHMMIQSLREREADDDEWDQLQIEVLTRLNPLIEDIEELHRKKPTNVRQWYSGARARAVVRRDVVSAGKYCIPKILIEIRNDESPVIEQLDQHVQVIRNHLSGDEPYPLTLAEARKKKQLALRAERTWQRRKNYIQNLDPATVAIVGIDVVAVVAGITIFLRRRRKSADR